MFQFFCTRSIPNSRGNLFTLYIVKNSRKNRIGTAQNFFTFLHNEHAKLHFIIFQILI